MVFEHTIDYEYNLITAHFNLSRYVREVLAYISGFILKKVTPQNV